MLRYFNRFFVGISTHTSFGHRNIGHRNISHRNIGMTPYLRRYVITGAFKFARSTGIWEVCVRTYLNFRICRKYLRGCVSNYLNFRICRKFLRSGTWTFGFAGSIWEVARMSSGRREDSPLGTSTAGIGWWRGQVYIILKCKIRIKIYILLYRYPVL
jgi:hypothetical protein